MSNKSKQNEAVEKVLKELNKTNKAYVVLFDLLNEQESTVAYELRYNDRTHMALDFKRWTVNEETEEETRKSVYTFMHNIIDQLLNELCENEITIKRIMVMEDGTICD